MKIYLAALTVAFVYLFVDNATLRQQLREVRRDLWVLETNSKPSPLAVSF